MSYNASYARFIFEKFFTSTIILYVLLFAQKVFFLQKVSVTLPRNRQWDRRAVQTPGQHVPNPLDDEDAASAARNCKKRTYCAASFFHCLVLTFDRLYLRFTTNPSLPHFTVTFAFLPHKYDDVASHRKLFTGHAFSSLVVFGCS
jgi:hypothetical protein